MRYFNQLSFFNNPIENCLFSEHVHISDFGLMNIELEKRDFLDILQFLESLFFVDVEESHRDIHVNESFVLD